MKKLEQYLIEKKIEYYSNCEIKPYLTMRIGGKVQFIIVANQHTQLKELLRFIADGSYPFIILGGGSNVVFSDAFTRLPVIIDRTSEIIKNEEAHIVKMNSGVSIKNFLSWAIENRVGGMDYLAGIPGAIGGAVAVNAGAFGQSISMALVKAEIFTPGDGKIKTVDKDYFRFQYRDSIFKYGSEVILDVYLTYTAEDSAAIRKKVKANLHYRSENHPPWNVHSAGCFFKNPIIQDKKVSAGKMIESAGFKGFTYGQLEVSARHANFIINKGGSSFTDLQNLEQQITRTVQEKNAVILEREVIYISQEGKKY
ncbi:MAG TPA: UDP-N-acetylmuramate dehydrogenase [Candidatus Deferrimicrobium sp.]|nr:UDP-N-acetylmuramate dehydrogenase [Candidatus Deferrimicrobium sp.]